VSHASCLTINVTLISTRKHCERRAHRTTTAFITKEVGFESGFAFDLFNSVIRIQQRVIVATNVTRDDTRHVWST